MSVKQWKVGDPCENCGGPLRLVPHPSDAERAAAKDPYSPVPIARFKDSATADQIAEYGDLYRCDADGFSVRVKPSASGSQGGSASGGQGDAPTASEAPTSQKPPVGGA